MEERVPFKELSAHEKALITYEALQRRKARRTLEKNKRRKVLEDIENNKEKYEISNYIYDRDTKYQRKRR